ncbi:MAG: hypothetical protein ABI693_19545 [Bryobacteraceae bacterium]
MAEQETKGALSSLAAVGSVLAASSCCLPLPAVIASAGLAGASGWMNTLRPWLMGGSLTILAWAFWQTYRRAACQRQRSRWSVALLWLSLGIVAGMLLFPQAIAGLLADLS